MSVQCVLLGHIHCMSAQVQYVLEKTAWQTEARTLLQDVLNAKCHVTTYTE